MTKSVRRVRMVHRADVKASVLAVRHARVVRETLVLHETVNVVVKAKVRTDHHEIVGTGNPVLQVKVDHLETVKADLRRVEAKALRDADLMADPWDRRTLSDLLKTPCGLTPTKTENWTERN